MNKKLLSIVSALVLLFALYAGTSWYIGGRVQTETNNAVDSLNTYIAKNWSDQVRLTLRGYERGTIISTSMWRVYDDFFPAVRTASIISRSKTFMSSAAASLSS